MSIYLIHIFSFAKTRFPVNKKYVNGMENILTTIWCSYALSWFPELGTRERLYIWVFNWFHIFCFALVFAERAVIFRRMNVNLLNGVLTKNWVILSLESWKISAAIYHCQDNPLCGPIMIAPYVVIHWFFVQQYLQQIIKISSFWAYSWMSVLLSYFKFIPVLKSANCWTM